MSTYKNFVIPRKDGKLVQSCHQIPAGSDVTSDEDAKGEDGERVHQLVLLPASNAPAQLQLAKHWFGMVYLRGRGAIVERESAVA